MLRRDPAQVNQRRAIRPGLQSKADRLNPRERVFGLAVFRQAQRGNRKVLSFVRPGEPLKVFQLKLLRLTPGQQPVRRDLVAGIDLVGAKHEHFIPGVLGAGVRNPHGNPQDGIPYHAGRFQLTAIPRHQPRIFPRLACAGHSAKRGRREEGQAHARKSVLLGDHLECSRFA